MQDDILELIKKSPGIKQVEACKKSGLNKNNFYSQVKKLEKWEKIRKEKYYANGYKLYPK